jgi:type II secretory pathway pseudopilin PulG
VAVTPRTSRRRAGFTLVEAVISILIVSVMLTAALHTVGASTRSQRLLADRATGGMLAQDLMNEIIGLDYEDAAVPNLLGTEPSENDSTRLEFDDVDDYDGWMASPPQYRDGTPMPVDTDYRRTAHVEWVKPTDVTDTVASDSGVKRIVVEVTFGGRLITRLTSFRSATLEQHAAATEVGP